MKIEVEYIATEHKLICTIMTWLVTDKDKVQVWHIDPLEWDS
jgi:hypothetical protein